MATSVLVARALLIGLRNAGFDADALLRSVDIESERLLDLRATLDVAEFHRLVCHAMDLSDDPGLGLTLGAFLPPQAFQLFGQLALSQPTLRDAFDVLGRHARLIADGPRFSLVEDGPFATFTFQPLYELGDSTRFALDLTLAMAVRLATWFTAGQRSVQQITFRHEAPSYARRYRTELQCPVTFSHPTNSITLPRSALDIVQPYADDTMRTVLANAAEAVASEPTAPSGFAERLKMILRHERDLSRTNLVTLAHRLGVTQRSLRRHLQAEAHTLGELVDQARCERSCELLKRSDASIDLVARHVGFAERSSFHRAFRRWMGMTPAEYTEKHARAVARRAPTSAARAN